ncbi:helix-turn-helix domain-containing protein [Brevundimonas nasdae]|uniref:helix-turn-helix domain-containing protein n=1 Tax=Brevundimonas nasdae TaxID=172043 RepID=UPI003F692C79
MSDVASAWAKAQDPVDDHGRVHPKAKDILKTMAPYADADGEVWAAVPVLAMECCCTERTIQRGLAVLKKCGLLIDTGTTKTWNSRVYPIYRMPLETGHASSVRRLAAERNAAKARSRGDAHVTPSADAPPTPMSPQGDTDVTPRGDTGVTLIGKGITQGLKPSASVRASEAAGKAWAAKAPERVAPVHVQRAWLAAIERSGETDDRLLSAVRACVARDPDFGRGKAMNLDRWLDEDRFQAWLPDDGALAQAPVVAGWSGPARVRSAVMEAMGAAGVASYLDPASWRDEANAVVAVTRIAADRLTAGAGPALRAIGVSVVVRGVGHG